MSYQVLARKWRPATFATLVGQEHVLKALRHALDSDRLHHAYLFTGTRGVGKTTIARILAKALNCERGVSATPCGECASCLEIAEGRSVDLIEVDAASRTKVEDTRELLDNVQYAPTRSRFKVYLIDEVHMLSGHSFNALLKTLEEPPEHVKFLLATTDPQRLPATVLSRCLQFNLKNLSAERIAEHLRHVLETEGIPADDDALWHLGRAAAGSMRDALSLTDQAIAFGDGELRAADVASMLGSVDRSQIHRLLEAVAADDPARALACVDEMGELGIDFGFAADELCSALHRIAIAQAVPGAVDREQGDAQRIETLARQLTAEDVQLFYDLAQAARGRLGQASEPREAFAMLVLRLLAFRPVAPLDPGLRAEDLEPAPASAAGEGGVSGKKPEPPAAAPRSDKHDRSAGRAEAGSAAATVESGDGAEPLQWHALLPQLKLSGSALNVASHCLVTRQHAGHWELCLDAARANLFNDRHRALIRQALSERLGRDITVDIRPGEIRGETPAMRARREAAERLAAAKAAIVADPRVQSLVAEFDAELLDDSVSVDGAPEPAVRRE
jgi:DNA polymerase-3 subunit gamma/tau